VPAKSNAELEMHGNAVARLATSARCLHACLHVRRIAAAASTSRPLEGALVVALEQAVAAPFCTSRLADAGARVIKIERKDGKGDFARGYDNFAHGSSSYFVWLNRGKESLALDLKDEADKALLHRMLAKADVWVQNMAPGAAERSGLGGKELRELYPRLIACNISGYGRPETANEYWNMKAYDMLVQAESGLSSLSGKPNWPTRVGVSVADIACGMYSHAAILEGLLQVRQTGKGCVIDASLFGSMADWMTVPLFHFEADGQGPAVGHGLRHPSVQPYAAYDTAGDPILISIQNEREFANLCEKVLEQPGLAADPRFCSNVARCENSAALDEVIQKVFKSLDRDVLLTRLREHGVAYGEVNDVRGFSRHPALARVPVETPDGSEVNAIAPPYTFDGAHRPLKRVPAYSEHSDAIRAEFAAA